MREVDRGHIHQAVLTEHFELYSGVVSRITQAYSSSFSADHCLLHH
jgi:hypothetical protein